MEVIVVTKLLLSICGSLHLLEEVDAVMADRGFEIHDLLAPKKFYLNIPLFMRRPAKP